MGKLNVAWAYLRGDNDTLTFTTPRGGMLPLPSIYDS